MSDPARSSISLVPDKAHVRQVLSVTWVSMVVNLFLVVFKLTAGLVGNSRAVVADSVHSTADLVTGVALLVGVRFWARPADESHPHGHRRIETAVTTLIGALLAVVGVGIIYDSIATRMERHGPPGWIAFAAAVASIISKEILYRWSIIVGTRIHSQAVVAHAWEHRSDALSSVPAAIAVAAAAWMGSKWSFIDHVGAVVVSVFILKAAWDIVRPALAQLVDAGAPEKVRQRIQGLTLATKGVRRVHAIRTRYMGPAIQVDLHIMVDPSMTVKEGHDISEVVKARLIAEGPEVVDVVVHLEPYAVPSAPEAT